MTSLLPVLAQVPVGGYISIWKVILVLLALLAWMRLLTWIDKDAQAAYLPRDPINGAFIGGAVLAFALFFMLPGFWVAFGVLIFLMLVEIGVYLGMRHQKVGLGDLQHQFKNWIRGKGGRKDVAAIAGQVQILDKGGKLMAAPNDEDPARPGYDATQVLLTDPLTRGAEQVDLVPGEGAAQVRYHVDGVPYNAPGMDRGTAAAGVTYIKEIAALNVQERRRPQTGKFRVSFDNAKHDIEVTTAGTTAGESLRMLIDPKTRHALKFPDLGFSDEQQAVIQESILEPSGIALLAAPKAQGLTSLLYGVLRAHDAFLTHIHTIERDQQADLEGITQNSLPANAPPADEYKSVNWVVSQEPDVLMLNSIEEPKSALELINHAGNGRKAYVGLRAGNTFEALSQWRRLVGDDAEAMKHLRLVICGRVMRRLCNACKVAYSPDPETVRKLNLDPARVSKLYQARTQPMRDQKGNPIPCEFCKELRYKGRFGVYEVLKVDDDVRQIVTSGGSLNQLRAVFRKQRGRLLQEMALLKVAEGETSVQEMLRVLKIGEPPASSSGGGQRATPAAPRSPAKPTR